MIGETMMVLMTFVFKVSPLGFSAGLWSMATALVVYVAVCLATKPQEHVGEVVDSINTFFELN